MGINLGLLGRVASSGLAGSYRGKIAGESEAYKRQTAAEERQREIDRQAITDSILQSGERRAAEDQARETEEYQYGVTQRPAVEAKATAELERTSRQNVPDAPDPLEWQRQGYPDWKTWRRDQLGKGSDHRAEWQRQGYTSFQEWRTDKSTSRSPEDDPERARRKYLVGRIPEIKKPRTERAGPGGLDIRTVPGLSTQEAVQQANEEWARMNGQPTGQESGGRIDPESTIRRYIQSQGGVTATPGAGAAPSAAPQEQATDSQTQRAERWEELVDQGMSPDEATRKVMEEFGR